MGYKFGETKRTKDHGLLIAIKKSINKNCKALEISKEDFAKELGTTLGTLENKLKMSSMTNDVTLSEFIHIMEITGDLTPLEYLCGMFDRIATSTEPQSEATNDSLHAKTDTLQIECSEAFTTVKQALKDKKLTGDEKEESLREIDEVIEAAMQLKQEVKSIKAEEE